jgi:uncharacterized protein YutE (UPF0331/DUF86 family)
MINKQLVKRKLKLILDDLDKLKKFKDYTFDEVAKDYYTHKAVERIIEVIINEAIDINQHIIVKKTDQVPVDYKQTFLKLGELEVLPKDFAKDISDSVGLRNILVHQYRELDEKIFYESISECLEQYTQYCDYIQDYLSSI